MVISLLLLGFTHSMLGKLEAGEIAFERAIAAAEARRDQAHLAAALNNRIMLWFGRADAPRLLADLRRVLSIARESGLSHMEGPVEANLSESLYCLGELALADQHVHAALAAHGRVGASVRTLNATELLLARIQTYCDDVEGAKQTVASIEARYKRAVGEGESDIELLSQRCGGVRGRQAGAANDIRRDLGRAVRELGDGGPFPSRARRSLGAAGAAELRAGKVRSGAHSIPMWRTSSRRPRPPSLRYVSPVASTRSRHTEMRRSARDGSRCMGRNRRTFGEATRAEQNRVPEALFPGDFAGEPLDFWRHEACTEEGSMMSRGGLRLVAMGVVMALPMYRSFSESSGGAGKWNSVITTHLR